VDELKALKETQGWGQCLVPAHLRWPLYRAVKWDDVVLFSFFQLWFPCGRLNWIPVSCVAYIMQFDIKLYHTMNA